MSWTDGLSPEETERPRQSPKRVKRDGTRERRYALAALEGEANTVRSAGKGTRNATLNKAAFNLGGYIAAELLTDAEVFDALFDAARDAGLGESEIKATIASGFSAGKKEPREVPEARVANDTSAIPEPPPGRFDDDKPAPAPSPSVPSALSIADVIDAWQKEGPLKHEPTGIKRLDDLTGGGPVYGSRWYLAGAPDAGKTALLLQIAHTYAERGIAVGLLAVDEEAGDLVTRLAQRIGYARHACEVRDGMELTEMRAALEGLPIRMYSAEWTIESAAADLAGFAREQTGGLAMLAIDSVQTVSCAAERHAQKELSEVAAVTARSRAIRAVATQHRLIAMATSEFGRSAYRNSDPDQQSSTLASAKWSGAIEYSARVLIGLRSVAGETDLIDLDLAKNKHGPRDEHVYLRIDRRFQTLTEAGYEPPPAESQADRDEAAVAKVAADAVAVARVLLANPGLGVRELRAKVRAVSGAGSERVDAAVQALGEAIVIGSAPRGGKPMSIDPELLPRHVVEALRNDRA